MKSTNASEEKNVGKKEQLLMQIDELAHAPVQKEAASEIINYLQGLAAKTKNTDYLLSLALQNACY